MGLYGCCRSTIHHTVKYLLVLINFLFWGAGIAAFILFTWVVLDSSFWISLTQNENHYYIGLYVFVVIASLLIIIGFLGCCGALKESRCMLVSFFCFLLVVLVAQVATAAWAYHYHSTDKLDQMFKESAKYTVQNYGEDARTLAFDEFQRHFNCCGANSPGDWSTSKFNEEIRAVNLEVSSPKKYFKVPVSCCLHNATKDVCDGVKLQVGATTHPAIFEKGCINPLIEALHNNFFPILAVIGAITGIEVFALLIALCLCYTVGKREDHYKS